MVPTRRIAGARHAGAPATRRVLSETWTVQHICVRLTTAERLSLKLTETLCRWFDSSRGHQECLHMAISVSAVQPNAFRIGKITDILPTRLAGTGDHGCLQDVIVVVGPGRAFCVRRAPQLRPCLSKLTLS